MTGAGAWAGKEGRQSRSGEADQAKNAGQSEPDGSVLSGGFPIQPPAASADFLSMRSDILLIKPLNGPIKNQ